MFFAGLIFASAALGVAVGYVTAGQTLTLFVDIDTLNTDRSVKDEDGGDDDDDDVDDDDDNMLM